MTHDPESVLTFWYEEIQAAQWWKKDSEFDLLIKSRFAPLHQAACRCELFEWRETPGGRLAEIIVLDQFSRNIYRDDRRAFDADPLALALAQMALDLGADQGMDAKMRQFLLMPFMHSESMVIHERALVLFGAPEMQRSLKSEQEHYAIIKRFGRYPHRNQLLGRESTPEELEFLTQPHSSF
jgi:uncharacterized protein (DUF924 family)